MFSKNSTPLKNHFWAIRGHNNQTTTRDAVRPSSPPPIYRHQRENGICIITDAPPANTTSQPSSSAAVTSSENGGNSYEKLFNTVFIRNELEIHNKRLAGTFSLPESLLLDYQSGECRGNSTNGRRCTCCLCLVRHRCRNTEICIENHPNNKKMQKCTREHEMQPKNTMLKYQKRHICDECMSSLTLNTKKNKQKKFRCCFLPCSIEIKSIALLRKHYLEHLMVKNFICNVCEKDFKSRAGLKMHESKHV